MDDLTANEDRLFDEWEGRASGLVRDGSPDPNAYQKSGRRLLFLLKEVNDKGGGDWDLRAFLRDGAQWQTWDNVTRWTRGIRALPTVLPWSAVSTVSLQDRQEVLGSIVAMNVKKFPGGAEANNDELKAALDRDADLLRRQFEWYKPEIVVCCGTDWLAVDLFGLPPVESWSSTHRGLPFTEIDGSVVLSYVHPAAWIKPWVLHYGLVDGMSDLLA